LVRVKYCGICGTDVHGFMYDTVPPGIVMGHEYCGTIARLGPGVSGWREGDRVVGGGGTPPPGKEPPAWVEPRYNYSEMGFAGRPLRAYAEFAVMEEWEPLPIPEGVSDEEAALCEPCAVAVRAVRRSRLKLGDTAAVVGAGPIGMFCAQAARAAGAGKVIVSEPTEARRSAVLDLGADAAIDPLSQDVVEAVVSATGGLGADVVFDCAGVKATLDQAFEMARREGQVVLVAVPWEPIPILPVEWQAREVSMQTTFGTRWQDYRIALDLIRRGRVTIGPMVSEAGFIPLEEIQQAFEALTQPTNQLQMVVKL